MPGPRRPTNDGMAGIWSASFDQPIYAISFVTRGLGLNFRFAQAVAPVTLTLLLILLVYFLLQTRPASTEASEQEALSEWQRLLALEKAGVIAPEELQSRKLKSLEKLIPLMKNKGSA